MSKKVLSIWFGILVLAVVGLIAQARNQTTISTALANQQAAKTFREQGHRKWGLRARSMSTRAER